ncbi:hypothetical protein ACFTZB_17555, partial [Rhodococcus sp. NPDC057014]|uniref:hypothetical protein n=1 Tax=Rhodococcus sp. NPDC057014 TaxID=3346000 RepID=UPI00363215B5
MIERARAKCADDRVESGTDPQHVQPGIPGSIPKAASRSSTLRAETVHVDLHHHVLAPARSVGGLKDPEVKRTFRNAEIRNGSRPGLSGH